MRSKGALTGSATTNSNTTINFGGTINLTTMGVTIGDLIVLRDSAESATAFTRNIVCRITAIPTTASITVAVALTTSAAVVNADWSIVRGFTTYPTVISDATNYPSGSTMYGKQSESGTYSDPTPANVLQAG